MSANNLINAKNVIFRQTGFRSMRYLITKLLEMCERHKLMTDLEIKNWADNKSLYLHV